VIPSIIVGTGTYLFWALFINSGSSIFLPICRLITGNQVLFMEGTLRFVDALVVALPLSVLTMVIMLALYRNKEFESDEEADSKPEGEPE
jgi:SSS family solute:Na+ symporter